jgi:hypothetical protein
MLPNASGVSLTVAQTFPKDWRPLRRYPRQVLIQGGIRAVAALAKSEPADAPVEVSLACHPGRIDR